MKESSSNKTRGVIITIAAYLVAIAGAIVAGRLAGDQHTLVIVAAGDIVATIIIFLFSVALNNSSMYDPYWSVKPLVIALLYFLTFNGEPGVIHYMTLIVVALYAIRLTMNFYRGWTGLNHEDWRYRDFRKNFPKLYWPISFLGIHLFPTIMVYLGCLSLYAIYSSTDFNSILAWTGILVTGGSVLLAYIADKQLWNFRLKHKSGGENIQSGLWKFSRHPNYLGEILTWWGLYIIALAAGTEYWWTIIGPATITIMFVVISIPMIEKRAVTTRPGYKEYKANTPMLIPGLK